jgi:hypothetical protein
MLRRFAVLLSFLATAPAAAQSVDTLAVMPGARLRVTARTGDRFPIATLSRQTSDSLVVFFECRSCSIGDSAIVRRDVRRVERYAGRNHWRGALKGMGLGLLAGTVIGAVAAKVAINGCAPSDDLCGLNVLLAPIGSVIGMVGGGTLGAISGTERWVRVWPDTPNR